jgi:hypothetical protein
VTGKPVINPVVVALDTVVFLAQKRAHVEQYKVGEIKVIAKTESFERRWCRQNQESSMTRGYLTHTFLVAALINKWGAQLYLMISL